MNKPFPVGEHVNWYRPFEITLFSTVLVVQVAAKDLFNTYAERTETNEPAGPYTLLEKLIEVYRRNHVNSPPIV